MVPLRLQVPPRPRGASHNARGLPPLMSTVHSLPLAKNPRASLVGDQNGMVASSVSASGRGSTLSSGRIQMSALPLGLIAVNASWWPSGERAIVPKLVCAGGLYREPEFSVLSRDSPRIEDRHKHGEDERGDEEQRGHKPGQSRRMALVRTLYVILRYG